MQLNPIKDLTPNQIKKLRVKEQVSQPVFAAYLNISPSTVKNGSSVKNAHTVLL
jgi:DNA-binding transcriptional regulator YiaG